MTALRTWHWGLAVAACIALATPAMAGEDDPVAARVNGDVIHLSEVEEARHMLPVQLQGVPLALVYDMLVDSLVNSRLAAAKAKRLGLHETPEYKRRMARVGEQVLERMLLTQYIEQRLTEERIQDLYVKMVEKAESQDSDDLPSYADARATLVGELSAELGQTLMEDLRAEAAIEKIALQELKAE